MDKNHCNEAIKAIIGARDMCGNEKSALAEYQTDNGVKFTQLELDYITGQVAYQWRINQQVAGVPRKYWVS